jgi:hypothetical protein
MYNLQIINLDYLSCYQKILEYKVTKGEGADLAHAIYDEYLSEKAVHELNILDEFRVAVKEKIDKKQYKSGLFREIEKIVISDLKENHSKFLSSRRAETVPIVEKIESPPVSRKPTRPVSGDFGAIKMFLDRTPPEATPDVTPGSSPRGPISPQLPPMVRVRQVPEIFQTKEFYDISQQIRNEEAKLESPTMESPKSIPVHIPKMEIKPLVIQIKSTKPSQKRSKVDEHARTGNKWN